jgi:hypothetical protein
MLSNRLSWKWLSAIMGRRRRRLSSRADEATWTRSWRREIVTHRDTSESTRRVASSGDENPETRNLYGEAVGSVGPALRAHAGRAARTSDRAGADCRRICAKTNVLLWPCRVVMRSSGVKQTSLTNCAAGAVAVSGIVLAPVEIRQLSWKWRLWMREDQRG